LSTWPMPLLAQRAASAMGLTRLILRMTRYMNATTVQESCTLTQG
jgi:hypothetical protein